MLDFRDIALEDKPTVEGYLKQSGFQGCEYSFVTMFIWRETYKTMIAEYGGFLVALWRVQDARSYLYPAGRGSPEELARCVEAICRHGRQSGERWSIGGITKENTLLLESLFPGRFSFTTNRDWYDYIYNTCDLIDLSGKKYHSKRNHINKFIEINGTPDYRNITEDLIPECRKAYETWLREKGGAKGSFRAEYLAVKSCFDHYSALGLTGGAIMTRDGMCSFSLGSPLNDDTFDVHIEKAVQDCPRGFTVINQQFAEHAASGYRYINREEDMGIEGLRKAKLSYHPAYLLEKYQARLKT